jgi:3'-phosphoadenosine 5'-phosphosulfate (PAPS) 3'-phosphatase
MSKKLHNMLRHVEKTHRAILDVENEITRSMVGIRVDPAWHTLTEADYRVWNLVEEDLE